MPDHDSPRSGWKLPTVALGTRHTARAHFLRDLAEKQYLQVTKDQYADAVRGTESGTHLTADMFCTLTERTPARGGGGGPEARGGGRKKY
jgi:hypothetical protein